MVGSNKTAVSEDTVKGQVRNILPKLGAKNRAHAGVIGGRRGIIELIKQIPELDILGDARKAKLAIELADEPLAPAPVHHPRSRSLSISVIQ